MYLSILSQFKYAWATSLISKGKWAKYTRVSVVLHRELGREPTKDELTAAVASKNDYKDVTPAEIVNHFDRGLEVSILPITIIMLLPNNSL